MSSQVAMGSGGADIREAVIPFAPPARDPVPDNTDQLDRAGQTILGLLHQAADAAEKNSQHALKVARDLSLQLQAAEGRIRDLEADVRYHQERADRAEKWLYQISVEIEERFFATANSRRAPPAPPTRTPGAQNRSR